MTIVGELEASLENVSPLDAAPALAGEKETCTVKLFPASNVNGSVTLPTVNGDADCTVMLLIVTEPLLAVTVTDCWLLDPTETVPKVRTETAALKVEGCCTELRELTPVHPL
ncbi:MAG TPA: hypothetical protein VMU05_05165 [Dongiaceae bacterium]|nr:hypothetical protein [Dongiaceae bacterium]